MGNHNRPKIPKRNIASLITGTFASMRLSALQVQRVFKTTEQKIRESIRREQTRYGNYCGGISGPGKRAGERIARQIAKGQLTEANGLQKNVSMSEMQPAFGSDE